MSRYCKDCGAEQTENSRFCRSCGTAVHMTQQTHPHTQPDRHAPAQPQSPIHSMSDPQAQMRQPPSQTQPPTQPVRQPLKQAASAKKHVPGKTFIISVAVILVIVLSFGLLPRLFRQADTSPRTAETDWSAFSYQKEDYEHKSKTMKVTGEKPSASAYGVHIDFGEYGIEGEHELEIKELPVKEDKDTGLKITAYDFKLGVVTEFNDVITIVIPYDQKYVEKGAENECVGAKYYNESTGEWEGVYYEVDQNRRQVLIYTTHLSTYGVFQVKNENTRKAYITDIFALGNMIGSNASYSVIKELADNGVPGESAFEAGFAAANGWVGDIGTTITSVTLGGQYDEALVSTLGNAFQHTGLAFAIVQTCYEFTYKFDDEQDKKATLITLVKNAASNAVGYFGSAALQVGFAGVYVFDMLLSSVQSDMLELKLENIGDVYQYYNDTEAPRSTGEWRTLFIGILQKNRDNPEKAKQLIDQEINNFCDRFWLLGYGKIKEIAGVSGKKYSFDERNYTKDRETLTAQYKAHLMNRLQAPLTSARKYLLTKAAEESRKELEKQLRNLQIELNKVVSIQIIEKPDNDGKLQYVGYTVRFAPLSSDASLKNWSGKLPKTGVLDTSFTIFGHMQCGSPNTVELYKPGEDAPLLSVPFKVKYPVTTIILNSNAEKEPDIKHETSGKVSPSPAPREFAWVLVETRIHDNQDKLKLQNETQKGIYETEATVSPGNITTKWRYVGESDTYPDPDKIHGEGAATQVLFGAPPSTFKAGETVSFSLSAAITENNLSFFDSNASANATFDRYDLEGGVTGDKISFTDSKGKSFFKADTYNDIFSVNATVSAIAPSGHQEGDKIGIHQSGGGAWNATVSYIYVWKAQ